MVLLSPLETTRRRRRKAGNSAKAEEGARMPSYEASMRNLAKAKAVGRPPRPWRSSDESRLIPRFVFLWVTCQGTKPSGRAWARDLGISHTWLQRLVRRFQTDPSEMFREQRCCGDPSFVQLSRSRQHTQQMRDRGELRPLNRVRFHQVLL